MHVAFRKTISVPGVPLGNYIVMVLASVTFMLQFTYDSGQQYLNGLILENWSFSAVLGHMWLHTSLLHIVCNLIVLWVFGRHVCLRLGNASYFFAYLFVGFVSAAAHIIFDGRPAMGASGAIMGILGIHVVLYFKRFSSIGHWIILTWFLLNLTVGVVGSLPAAYLAHAGGFLGGLVLGGSLVFLNIADVVKDSAVHRPDNSHTQRSAHLSGWRRRSAR